LNIIGSILLGSTVLTYPNIPPSVAVYNNLKVYGGGIVDHIHVKSTPIILAEMQTLPLYTPPVWDGETVFLANFQNSLTGGTSTTLSNPLESWTINRRKTTESAFTQLASLPATAKDYFDITAEPNCTYIYQVLGVNATEISEPLENTLVSSFFNTLLIDPSTGLTFIFDINLDFSGYENETAHERYDGYNKFSTHTFGKRNFRTGDVKAIISEDMLVDGIVQTTQYLKTFQDFVNNGNEKILKDRKGNVLKVVTTGGVQQEPLNVGIAQQPYSVSFHFEEVGEVNG